MDEVKDAPSPFLPGTNIQYAWDSTSIGYLKQCGRLYQYVMIDGWSPKGDNIHLRFGQEFHTALEDYEHSRANKLSHDDSVHDVIRALLERTFDWKPDEMHKAYKYKNRHALVRAVIWYLDYYQQDNAKTFIKEDGKPAVELSFRFELEWGPTAEPSQPYLLCGHLDRVVTYMDHLMVMDHKTTTTTPSSYYFDQFEPNNQMSLYTLAARVIFESPIKGVIIDAGQLLVESFRPVRGLTYRTPDQLDEWLEDLRYWLHIAESYAQVGYWPMNDTACDKYGGCRFREICSKSPQVREQFLKSNFEKLEEKDRWNPLKTR